MAVSNDEQAVLAMTTRFYEAIEQIVSGKGVGLMKECWHQTSRVTSSHPIGEWSHGWSEILATWEVAASLGSPAGAGSTVRDLRAHVYGDIAYVTGTFKASPGWGGATLSVTDILHKVDGAWRIIHHHADKAPSMEKSLDTMAAT